jgi:2-polyprenyl-3-methyl-5-hydroxy-6-metoxy-1,4-benzoquinol methylase
MSFVPMGDATTGRFDTDTSALRSRAEINATRGKHDLDDWIVRQVAPARGMRVLDLGCGTGKQVFRLAPLVLPDGSVLGIDAAEAAVQAVNTRAHAEGLSRVTARQMGLDDCPDQLRGETFDLVLSTYAIYYARDPVAVLRALSSLVSDGGTVFVCGPGQGTNREIIDIVNAVALGTAARTAPTIDFFAQSQIDEIAKSYRTTDVARLENEIAFDSPTELLEWWRHHNSFVPAADAEVQRQIEQHFARHARFALTKNVLGVRFCV